ncbi:MAG: hypothetical protein EON98_12915, partial [Chitinophagaceae bacterium]
MRKIIAGLLMLMGFFAKAQVYNNEWIDYSKTYYKFRVGKDGACRISGATLASVGLGTAQAQHFQLWRNGVQVPIYTSVASGPMSGSDYIEFWGKMNDGKPDKELYRDPSFQLNDKWSLITDSSTYFLTVNPTGPNFRLQPTANNVSGNTLPAETYFMYTAGIYYKDKVNNGLFYVVGTDHLFSSSFDQGEGWTSVDIGRNGSITNSLTNLFAASTGPAPTIKTSISGNAYNSRYYKVTLNGDSVLGNPVPYMNESTDQATFNLNLLNSGTASISVFNMTDPCPPSQSCPTDNMVVHKVEITYPRRFNFGGA